MLRIGDDLVGVARLFDKEIPYESALRVEGIGPDWVVVRPLCIYEIAVFRNCDPDDLWQYCPRNPNFGHPED